MTMIEIELPDELFNQIQKFLQNSNLTLEQFVIQAVEHELERQRINDVLNTVLDKFKSQVSNRICPDEKVCAITIENGDINVPTFDLWVREKLPLPISESDNQKIIILMESPHKDEFTSNIPNGVAFGKTGKNIASKLEDILIEISHRKTIQLTTYYDLYLVNAVPFQCSCGFSTSYFRDLMFVGLWFNGANEYFISRLTVLNLRTNDIVINACTHGGHSEFKNTFEKEKNFNEQYLRDFFQNNSITYKVKYGLRWLVCKAILKFKVKNKLSFIYQQMNHPCNWDRDISYR